MRLHHVGYAVRDINKSRKAFEMLGCVARGEVCDDERRNVKILFMACDGGQSSPPMIELIEKLDSRLPSPVDSLLKNRRAAPYHLCYEVAGPDETAARLTSGGGYRLLREAAPAPAVGERRVVFLYSIHAGIVELLEAETRSL
jgi:methylmalonyl-CoA/ethylmalonyl-CoA epimerase